MKGNDLNLYKSFKDFVEEKWGENDVHSQGDFVHLFSIDSRHSRYYLLKLVEEGVLCKVTYGGRVYYMKRRHQDVFKQFGWIGVKVR